MKRTITSIIACLLVTLAAHAQYDTWVQFDGSFSYDSWTSSNQGQDDTSSSLTISFTCGEGSTLSFSYSVNSETGYDKLSAKLDGVDVFDPVSGDVSDNASIDYIEEGLHTLVFTYSKDGSASNGNDQATVTNIVMTNNSIQLQWVKPEMKLETGIPPYNEEVVLKLVDKGMYLTKGTTWGTHAALTDNVNDALVYQLESYNGYTRLHSDGVPNTGYLFVAGTCTNTLGNSMGNVYVDYNGQNETYTYFTLNELGDGFTINIPQANQWWSSFYNSPGLGWDAYNDDVDRYGNSYGTNVGIFMLAPGDGYCNKWQYYNVSLYNARLNLYNELKRAYINGEEINEAASDIYNNPDATLDELKMALKLQRGEDPSFEDYTAWVYNPNFNGSADGWTVDMPGAQNKGYQNASYTNGECRISGFVETWIVQPGYLGAGEISQTISGLPDGVYRLEADINVKDQSGRVSECQGVYMFAESDIFSQKEVSTQFGNTNAAPTHFSLTFVKIGNDMKIGMRTDADCTANWVAFDNVQLFYGGDYVSDATDVTLDNTSMELIATETQKLTASVTASSLYQAVIWASDNEYIATVDKRGNVTAHHAGTAHITATAIGTSLTATCTITVGVNDISHLVINEVQVSNLDQYLDPSFNYGGWIEIYNPGSRAAALGGAIVCDATDKTKRFQLPANFGVVPARGYRNIWFDHNAADGSYGGQSDLQVNFKLSADGGVICLMDGNQQEVDRVSYPVPTPRCSYARATDGGSTWGTTGAPTPERSNDGTVFATERSAAPVISTDGKVVSEGEEYTFEVTVPANSTLLCTSDGSAPTLQNAYSYTYRNNDPLETTFNYSDYGTRIYRFCVIEDGKLPSPVVTRSFIAANHDYYLPILSVTSAEDNLFGSDYGIYTSGNGVNGTTGNGISYNSNTNRDWERPVNMEFMVPEKNSDGTTSFITYINQETDMEIAGGWTRNYYGTWLDDNYWPMRSSFRLKTDKRYEGANSIDYPVFDHKPYNKYKVWQVRNGGNDRTSSNRFTDALLNEVVLSSGFYIDAQDWQPAHIFLNGKYVGVFNIRESNNRHYGDSNYGIDTDEMDQFDLSNAQYNQKVGTEEAWNELVELSAQLAYNQSEATYQEILKRIDMEEYINYMAFECSIGSSDWLTNRNNFKGFRSRTDDGKFHFVLFDADGAFSNSNMLSSILNGDISGINVDDLFRNLMQYEPCRRMFIDATSIVCGSVLMPEVVTNAYFKLTRKLDQAMSWEGQSGSTSAATRAINLYSGRQPITNARNQFGMGNPYYLTLSSNISDAQLSLNGQPIPTGKFAGDVYNYNGNGINLTAKAPAGYRFLGWMQDGYTNTGNSSETTTTTLIGLREAGWSLSDYYVSRDNEAWTLPYYVEDGTWTSHQAPFGFASGTKYMQTDPNTNLEKGDPRIPTYYFRHHFSLSGQPAAGSKLVFRYRIDDGFRAYINGTDIGGLNISTSRTGYNNYTDNAAYAGDSPLESTIEIPVENLDLDFSGNNDNVLCVLLKNCSSSSSDIYFDCSLELKETNSGVGSSDFISTDETFCITDVESAGDYTLTAMYEPIADQKQRWEAGATPVRINEVSAGNDIYINEYGKRNDWVELYNTTDADIDVAGMYLSDNAKKPQKWQIVRTNAQGNGVINTIIPAHGRLIVWCDDLAPVSHLHSGFKLSNADGACVSIQDERGRWADRLTYLEQPRWHTYGRYPDGGNSELLMSQPTIAKANRVGLADFTDVSNDGFLSDDISVTLDLAEGWNWTSHNLAENVDKSRFTTYAEIIRGRNSELFKDDVLGWQGTLKYLEAAQGYKICMQQSAEVTLRGDLYNSLIPVSVQKGWNWLGCPLSNVTVLDAALANYVATDGDQIVSQDGFAVYSNGAWTGTLTVLNPGRAYMLKSATSQQFCWNPLGANNARQRRYTTARNSELMPWNLNIHAYPNVMTLIAEVKTDGIELEGAYSVGAFVGDECRGIGEIVDGRLLMNIHGQGGETLSFRLMDVLGDTYTSAQMLQMQDLAMVGTLLSPYTLRFAQSDIDEIVFAHADAGKPVVRQYYTLSGVLLPRPAKGLNIVKITYDNGTTATRIVRY